MPENERDEFSYMSSHRRQLKNEERLKQERAKQMQNQSLQQQQQPQTPPITSHPPYGKPYKSDKRPNMVPKQRTSNAQNQQQHTTNQQRELQRRQAELKRQAEQKAKQLRQAQQRAEEKRRAMEKKRLNAARRESQKYYLKALLSAYVARLIAMIIVGLVIFAVSFITFRISLSLSNSPSQDDYTYIIGGEKTKLDYKIAVRNGVVYLCGDDIANLCNLTVAGDEREIKYISPKGGNETASFRLNTRTAYVNKNEIRLTSETFKEKDRLYIPLDFFENYMQGINIVYDETDRTVTVKRIVINASDVSVLGTKEEYANITYKIKNSQAITALNENVLSADSTVYKYDIDITPYEKYINPSSIFEYVKVINKTNPAEETFKYNDLTVTSNQSVKNKVPVKLRLYAAKSLEAMLLEAKESDVTRYAVFRGYVTLEDLKADAEDDKNHVKKYGQPQYDENLLGLTAEVYFGNREDSYGDSDVFEWFEENAHRFGFIVRYPDGKEASTGVEFRPWTLRFVGRYSATRMYEENLSLEEYVEKYNLNR